MGLFGFIGRMFTATCVCGKKATQFPHGIPCCDECACDVDCSSWLGYECDCSKSKETQNEHGSDPERDIEIGPLV